MFAKILVILLLIALTFGNANDIYVTQSGASLDIDIIKTDKTIL